MRHSRRLALNSISVVALTLGMLLSGCGATPTTPVGQGATAANTATAVAPNTPFPTAPMAPATAASFEVAGCPPVAWPVQPQYGAVDGLRVSIPQRWTTLDFPEALMPNTLPSAPYQVPLTASEAQQVGAFHPNPPVNPSLATGYYLQVCNQTSAAHTITSLGVSITSFTPSSGPVTVWRLCQDGPYDAATRHTTPVCGGGFGQVDWLAATLPGDSAGASALATTNTQAHANGANPPVVIPPNESIGFLIAVDGLTSQGTYTLGFGISVDGAAQTTLTPSDGAFFIAPSAIVWTGTACESSVMQAHIPASSQDSYYVCPPTA